MNDLKLKENKILNLLDMAYIVAKNSPDLETQVGAIILTKDTESIISTGYNGFVRGAPDHKLPNTRPDKYIYMQHAETNALCNAARHGISVNNAMLVTTLSPCIRCIRQLYQSGIDLIVYDKEYKDIEKSNNMGDLNLQYTNYKRYNVIYVQPAK